MTECAQSLVDRALGLSTEHSCPSCAASFQAWRAGLDVEPSPFLATRILANVQAQKPVRRWKVLAALASLVAIAALAVRVTPREEVPPEVVALAHWQSPTASLLRSTADPLLKTVPRLGTGVQP